MDLVMENLDKNTSFFMPFSSSSRRGYQHFPDLAVHKQKKKKHRIEAKLCAQNTTILAEGTSSAFLINKPIIRAEIIALVYHNCVLRLLHIS